ncbi:proton-coupled zinc antiporter SLC30A9, mitochondrial-like [Lineus longissimus]|uniref:proton-coupled zinc antiporter SLC30A9, mitochondrial-like n=1 Tax=Lineus longissimus TaxID=88925 RepID=UPI002B4EBA0F
MFRYNTHNLRNLAKLLHKSTLTGQRIQEFAVVAGILPCKGCHVIDWQLKLGQRTVRTYRQYGCLLPIIVRASSSSNDGKNDEADSTKDPPPARENSPKSSQTGAIKGNTPNQAGSKVTDPVLQSTGVEKPKVVVQGEATQEAPTKKKKKQRSKIDWSASYTDNSYTTPVRAITDYYLTSSELEKLPKYSRRSPFPELGRITVYLKSDVEKKAYEVFSGKENFLKHRAKMRGEKETHDKMTTLFRKAMKQYKTAVKKHGQAIIVDPYEESVKSVFRSGSGRVVLYAVTINAANFFLKLVAWLYTGSHSMFSEAIHSAADTVNQMILAFGIHRSIKKPDSEHPYGYSNMRYVSSLISGVGIFCLGAGLSWYHGIHGLLNPAPLEATVWAVGLLGGSLFSEGATLFMAINQAKLMAKRDGLSVLEYVRRGYEPMNNVVLLEDFAAVLGVGVAATCLTITMYTGNLLADCVGSMVIGGLLAGVASFIIYTNTTALVGRAIPPEKTVQICALLESDRIVRALHDVKATDMGGKYIRFKAEVDFDGKELTRSYMDKLELENLLGEMQKLKTIEEVEDSMLKHGEMIIDILGSEVDRLEQKIVKKFPEVRHVDLEVL